MRATTPVADEVDPAGLAIDQGSNLIPLRATTPVADEVDLDQDPLRAPITVADAPITVFSLQMSPDINILDSISVRAAAVAARTEMWEDRDDAGDDKDTDLSPEKSDKDTNMGGGGQWGRK